jgi:hypothetical protein
MAVLSPHQQSHLLIFRKNYPYIFGLKFVCKFGVMESTLSSLYQANGSQKWIAGITYAKWAIFDIGLLGCGWHPALGM